MRRGARSTLYAWPHPLAMGGAINWWATQLHSTWVLEALLAAPLMGGPSLSLSARGIFVFFVNTCLPFMILQLQAAIERIPASTIEASADLAAGALARAKFFGPVVSITCLADTKQAAASDGQAVGAPQATR